MRVIDPSPHRVEPRCRFARQCGGCQIQEMSYERQLEFKQKKCMTTWCGSGILIRS